MKITRDEYAKSYVIEIEGKCYYWNPPIESRLNQNTVSIEAPSQEPVPVAWGHFYSGVLQWPVAEFKEGAEKDLAMYDAADRKKMDVRPLYTTPPNAAAQIESLKAQLEGAKVMYEAMSYKADTAAAQIAESKELLTEAYADADEVLRPQIAQLQASLNAAQNVADDSFKQIADLQRTMAKYVAETITQQRQITQLQAENADLRECNKNQAELNDLATGYANQLNVQNTKLTAAARMTIDCWECEQMLTDAVLIQLRAALGDSRDL